MGENANGYSLSDISAVTNGIGMGGNNSMVWLLILFFFITMISGGGWNRNGDYGQYATAASQQDILFNQKFADLTQQATANYTALDNKIDRLANGLADLGYANLSNLNAAKDAIAGAVINEGRGLQMQIGNEGRGFQQIINEGFCGTNRNIDAVRYEAKANAGDIIAAIRADGEATRNLFQQNEIQKLRDRLQSVEMDNRMCGVVRYPMGFTYAAQNPFCNCGQQVQTGCCGCNA